MRWVKLRWIFRPRYASPTEPCRTLLADARGIRHEQVTSPRRNPAERTRSRARATFAVQETVPLVTFAPVSERTTATRAVNGFPAFECFGTVTKPVNARRGGG